MSIHVAKKDGSSKTFRPRGSMPAIYVEPHIEPTMTITKTDRSPYSHINTTIIPLFNFILMINHYYYYYYYFYYSLMTCHLSPDFLALFEHILLYKANPYACTLQFVTDEDSRGRNVLLETSFLAT